MTDDRAAAPLAEFYEQRAGVYRTFGNGSLRTLVSGLLPRGGRLLDVGCASGGLLHDLREQAGYSAGIEMSESAAKAAAKHADHVVVGDIADDQLDIGESDFDVIVLADVLEHVVEPLPALKRAAQWCSPRGSIVISVPNIAHWRARAHVLRGRWEYTDSGTLDHGHLRFFTRASIEELVEAADLELEHVAPVVPALRNHAPVVSRLPAKARRRLEGLWQELGARRPEILGYQLLIVCRPRHPSEEGSRSAPSAAYRD